MPPKKPDRIVVTQWPPNDVLLGAEATARREALDGDYIHQLALLFLYRIGPYTPESDFLNGLGRNGFLVTRKYVLAAFGTEVNSAGHFLPSSVFTTMLPNDIGLDVMLLSAWRKLMAYIAPKLDDYSAKESTRQQLAPLWPQLSVFLKTRGLPKEPLHDDLLATLAKLRQEDAIREIDVAYGPADLRRYFEEAVGARGNHVLADRLRTAAPSGTRKTKRPFNIARADATAAESSGAGVKVEGQHQLVYSRHKRRANSATIATSSLPRSTPELSNTTASIVNTNAPNAKTMALNVDPMVDAPPIITHPRADGLACRVGLVPAADGHYGRERLAASNPPLATFDPTSCHIAMSDGSMESVMSLREHVEECRKIPMITCASVITRLERMLRRYGNPDTPLHASVERFLKEMEVKTNKAAGMQREARSPT
jgi:hypothetical protein